MKNVVVEVVACLAYWLGIDALFYWLNRKAKRILTFHNVLPDELFRPRIANGVSNRLSDFERIIDECAKRFKFSTDLFDSTTLTVTFDDGYRNQYTTAFKALQKRGIPAYLFVAGDIGRVEREEGAIDNRVEHVETCRERGDGISRVERVERLEGLVVDLLTHWIDNVPAGRYVVEAVGAVDINSESRMSVWSNVIWPMFMADAEHKGASVLKACDKAYPIEKILASLPEDYRKERFEGVTKDECEEMRNAGWKIGWHTLSHYPLAKLSEYDQHRELDSPPEFRNVCLSYPYGNPVEVGDAVMKIAEELGYPCAVSNTNEVEPSQFFLPRMSVLPDKDKYRLHFQLSGLEYFLKHRRLLPVV